MSQILTIISCLRWTVIPEAIGGSFLVIGLLTRVVVLFQIPILFGAVFLVHSQEGAFAANSSLEYAVLVLLTLVVFAFYGSGKWSVDYLLDKSEKQNSLSSGALPDSSASAPPN